MFHQFAVELGETVSYWAGAQQAAKHVMQAEEASTEIQIDQQRQIS